jgi:hypothetical protein
MYVSNTTNRCADEMEPEDGSEAVNDGEGDEIY